jgi:hypothetical protein
MKKITLQIGLALILAARSRADTSLTILSPQALEGCLFNNIITYINQPSAGGSFSLSGVSGSGVFQSDAWGYSPYPPYNTVNVFHYTLDLSAMAPAPNHCVKLIMHFGTPEGCSGAAVGGSPAQFQSATLSPYGDVTFVFANGCLQPGQSAITFEMLSGAGFKTNLVTIIDDYTNLASGQTNETVLTVPAIVPAVAPNYPPWAYAQPPFRFPSVIFQGHLDTSTNEVDRTTNRYGTLPYDLKVQLFDAPTNGLALSQVFTQSVQVVNGLFNLPLPFEPVSMADGSARWLDLAVRPTGSNTSFTALSPRLPLSPSPQALYAFSAGTVASLGTGQAVTRLNGLTDAVTLQAGSGIILGTNGNTLTITAQAGAPSDRNIKTDFAPVSAEKILARVSELPITSWRYTNETPGIRHIGPMAQDFRAAFSLGQDDKFIQFVDEQGVALTAIQGLNEKLQRQSTELERKEAEIQDLKQRLQKLESSLDAKASDH